MKQVLLVGILGAAGAIVRFVVSAWTLRKFGETFPLGTLLVNVVGCGLIGALFRLDESVKLFSNEWRAALAAGFLGGLTTFSTFGLETIRMTDSGRHGMAVVNVLAHIVLGLISVVAGMTVVSWLVGSGK